MDKELIRNRLERLRVQKDLMSSLYQNVLLYTTLLEVAYKDLDAAQGLEAATCMSYTKDDLNLTADRLSYCANFISETSGLVGNDSDEIFNSSFKSTDEKQ